MRKKCIWLTAAQTKFCVKARHCVSRLDSRCCQANGSPLSLLSESYRTSMITPCTTLCHHQAIVFLLYIFLPFLPYSDGAVTAHLKWVGEREMWCCSVKIHWLDRLLGSALAFFASFDQIVEGSEELKKNVKETHSAALKFMSGGTGPATYCAVQVP